MPKVSIILTIYNKPEWLNECIDSVLAQTMEDFELIMLEDNSPDPKVRKIIDSYDDPRIVKYFSDVSEDDRYSTARYATLINIGVKDFAMGKYITYLTDDDMYYPDRLQVMSDYLEANPEVHVVYGPQRQIDANGGLGGIRETQGILDDAFNKVDHNSVMHTIESFHAVGQWYDVAGVWGGADAYFWRHLNQKGYKFYPVGDNADPLDAKRYHDKNVQALIVQGKFFPEGKCPW